jgi:hypothetical protein
MSIELHVLKDDLHIATFPLVVGTHLLGVNDDADLVLASERVPSDVCFVKVSDDGDVSLEALPNIALRRHDGEKVAELPMGNGTFAEAAGVRLTLLRLQEETRIEVDAPREMPVTAKSSLIHEPPRSPVVLRITTEREQKIVELDRPKTTLGRSKTNTVRIAHIEVSEHHAAIVWHADGPWLEDAGSTNGTYLNGVPVKSCALPVGARVCLSPSPSAPIIEVLTLEEAMAWEASATAALPLIGRGQAMRLLRDMVLRYARLDMPVLIRGETGTGKELVARALWRGRGKDRQGNDRPFVAVNCGALERELVGSELFGHRRGAFTSAPAHLHRSRTVATACFH